MKRFTLWGVALVMVLGLCSASQPLSAQQTTASITGTVEDSSGAALTDATVTAQRHRAWYVLHRQNHAGWRIYLFQSSHWHLRSKGRGSGF